mmetsp:Transcript_23920/g.21258  ORF Transcript_23920/g.21258 Transcript_23920/m.21258 type:complete len:143 (+) Transcript_23920:410-838(+)
MGLFPINFDPDIGNIYFIILGIFYWYLLLLFTLTCYLGENRVFKSLLFYANPVHWICLILSFPIFIISSKLYYEINKEKILQLRGVQAIKYNTDIEQKAKSIYLTLNINNQQNEDTLSILNTQLQLEGNNDALPNEEEFDIK